MLVNNFVAFSCFNKKYTSQRNTIKIERKKIPHLFIDISFYAEKFTCMETIFFTQIYHGKCCHHLSLDHLKQLTIFLKLSSWYFHVTAMQNPKRGHFKGEILFKNSEFFMNIKWFRKMCCRNILGQSIEHFFHLIWLTFMLPCQKHNIIHL